MNDTLTTLDGILNRRLWLAQPQHGFRVAIDTVFLAASVPVHAQQRVLDMGCGVGGVLLALAVREPSMQGYGIEVQPFLAQLAAQNFERNGFTDSLQVATGSVLDETLIKGSFYDHVAMNPPYHDEARHEASPDPSRRKADYDEGNLALWVACAARALRPEGCLTMIHRADRLSDIKAALKPFFKGYDVKFLLPKKDRPAKRVLVRAWKEGMGAQEKLPLVLHEADGSYTPQADAVLREAQPLAF